MLLGVRLLSVDMDDLQRQFVFSGHHGLACQQEISLVLAKAPPILYQSIVGQRVQ